MKSKCKPCAIAGLFLLGARVSSPSEAAKAREYVTFDIPGAASTAIRGIDAAGNVVGDYEAPDGSNHGFVMDKHGNLTPVDFLLRDGAVTLLDVPGARGTVARGVNERGDVAGFYTDFAGVSHGFVWR